VGGEGENRICRIAGRQDRQDKFIILPLAILHILFLLYRNFVVFKGQSFFTQSNILFIILFREIFAKAK
jgi:hypothetical protein